MNLCRDGQDHRFEFWECKEGYNWFRCMNMNCGEVMEQYHDTGCGG